MLPKGFRKKERVEEKGRVKGVQSHSSQLFPGYALGMPWCSACCSRTRHYLVKLFEGLSKSQFLVTVVLVLFGLICEYRLHVTSL